MKNVLAPVEEVDRILTSLAPAAATEWVDFRQARGRTLMEAVIADRDHPPYPRAAMDGIVVRLTDQAEYRGPWAVEGLITAGIDPGALDPGVPGETRHLPSCMEIMTGAAMPQGGDTVVPYEDIEIQDGVASLRPGLAVQAGRHVHAQGSDAPRGSVLLQPGTVISAPQVAVLASVGLARVPVRAPLRAWFLGTGDELVPVEEPEPRWYQVRQSNRWALEAEWLGWGGAVAGNSHLPDEAEALRRAVAAAADQADIIVLSGGVSMGKKDLVPQVLKDLGMTTLVHGVDQKPGKPLLVGTLKDSRGRSRLVLGLPGNPVSSVVCFRRYGIPLLGRGSAQSCHFDGVAPPEGRGTTFVAVERVPGAADRVRPVPVAGSGDLVQASRMEGFAELGRTHEGPVPVWFWS